MRPISSIYRFSFLAATVVVPLVLAGCELSVETNVRGSGKVVQTVTIVVPEDDFPVALEAAQQYLRDISENWKITTHHKREIIARRKFSAKNPSERDLLENVRFHRRRSFVMGWLIPVDHLFYEQEINAAAVINSEQKRALAEQTEVKYFLTLPGRIAKEDALGAIKVQGGTALWKGRLDQGITVKAESTAFRSWWFFFELIILAFLIWALMPVVTWFNEVSARYAEKRKTARVEKMRKREQALAAKAARQAAKEAARAEREARRRAKIEAAEKRRAAKEEERRRKEEAARQKKEAREAKRRADQEKQEASEDEAKPLGEESEANS